MAPLGIRKQLSGAEKRRRRKKIEEFVKSQANAMLKFIKKPEKSTISEPIFSQRNNNEDREEIGQSNVEPENLNEVNENVEQDEVVCQSEKEEHISEDLSDPSNWRNVNTRLRDVLVENGPMARLPSDYQFPKDAIGRCFSHECYIRVMANREKVDRQWLVYSTAFDKAFCFCCKLFRDDQNNDGGKLVTTGYNDWRNVSERLKEHETSYDHILHMTRWKQLEIRQQDKKAIDIGQSKVNPVNLDECKENDEIVYQSEESEKKKEHVSEDISDPGNWGKIDTRWRDLLVKIGPTTRLSSDYQLPKDSIGRRFSYAFYIRELVNGEKLDRQWLVYSKALDKAFCFCCKLFRDDQKNGGGNLATIGYNDWRNIPARLKEHERHPDHMICMNRWKMLEIRLQKNQTIDKLINL